MTILVTGSEGFIGKALVAKIKSNTPHDVVTYDVRVDKNRSKLHYEYDIIYHLGAISDTRVVDKELIYMNNIESLQVIINNQRVMEKPAFISFASSASVYGTREQESFLYTAFDESDPVKPETLYAKSKYAGELLLELSGLRHNNLRLFNVYSTDFTSESHKIGYSSPHHKFFHQNEAIEVFEGSDEIFRDFIHVNDVVDAFIRLTEREGTFNIGTGKTKSFLDVARSIQEITGVDIRTIPFPSDITSYQRYTCASRSVFDTINES